MQGFSLADLAKGEPTIVNVFASWCVDCHEEHPLLLALAKQPGVRLYGINYKDDPAAARRFLGRYGNPLCPRRRRPRRAASPSTSGVYGVPETYVIGGDGKIAYRHVGPLTEDAIKEKILPLLQPPEQQAARLKRRLFARWGDDQVEDVEELLPLGGRQDGEQLRSAAAAPGCASRSAFRPAA